MTPRQKTRLIEDLESWMTRHGYKEDKYGNYIKTVEDRVYRMKFNKTSLRYEGKVFHADGTTSWVRLRTGYYSQMSINSGDQLVGLIK